MENTLNEKKVISFLTAGAILVILAMFVISMLITTDVSLGLSTASATWAASHCFNSFFLSKLFHGVFVSKNLF